MQIVCSPLSPLPDWLLVLVEALRPQLAAHHLHSKGWKSAFYTKWHTDFLDSLSLMHGRCFPARGLSRLTAHLQSSWSFSVILAGKLHSFLFPRNFGLWPMASPTKKLSQRTSGWAQDIPEKKIWEVFHYLHSAVLKCLREIESSRINQIIHQPSGSWLPGCISPYQPFG